MFKNHLDVRSQLVTANANSVCAFGEDRKENYSFLPKYFRQGGTSHMYVEDACAMHVLFRCGGRTRVGTGVGRSYVKAKRFQPIGPEVWPTGKV